MQRYGVFFILQIFSQLFLKVFCSLLKMREIFFEEKLVETRRNSDGGASRTGKDGRGGVRAVGAVGVVRAVGAMGAVG